MYFPETGVSFVEKVYDVEVKEREPAVFACEVSHPDAKVNFRFTYCHTININNSLYIFTILQYSKVISNMF